MRKLKIYDQSMGGGNYTYAPTILLKGKWLEEAGLHIGEYVSVEINGGKILLTKTTPPETKTRKQSIEEKINGSSKSQLKELNAYLDGMKGEGTKR